MNPSLFNQLIVIELGLFRKAAFLNECYWDVSEPHRQLTYSSRRGAKPFLIENALLETRENFEPTKYRMGDIYRKTWAVYRRMDAELFKPGLDAEPPVAKLTPDQIHEWMEANSPAIESVTDITGMTITNVIYNKFFRYFEYFLEHEEYHPFNYISVSDLDYIITSHPKQKIEVLRPAEPTLDQTPPPQPAAGTKEYIEMEKFPRWIKDTMPEIESVVDKDGKTYNDIDYYRLLVINNLFTIKMGETFHSIPLEKICYIDLLTPASRVYIIPDAPPTAPNSPVPPAPEHTMWVSTEALEQYLLANLHCEEIDIYVKARGFAEEYKLREFNFMEEQVAFYPGNYKLTWVDMDHVEWVKFIGPAKTLVLKKDQN